VTDEISTFMSEMGWRLRERPMESIDE